MIFLVIVLGLLLGFFFIATLAFAEENEKLRKKIENRERWKKNNNNEIELNRLRYENEMLINENRRLRFLASNLEDKMMFYRSTQAQPEYDKDVVEAVRKAMIYSHPDKGNCSNSDDFIKYKKIYDKLKGDNKNGKQHY